MGYRWTLVQKSDWGGVRSEPRVQPTHSARILVSPPWRLCCVRQGCLGGWAGVQAQSQALTQHDLPALHQDMWLAEGGACELRGLHRAPCE